MNSHFFCDDAKAFLRLLHTPGGLLAVRSLHPQEEWHFCREDLPRALPLLQKHSGQRALYTCLNPVRLDIGDGYAEDKDVTALRWFPLDADPVRPAGTASTDAEKAAAEEVLDSVLEALRASVPDLDASFVRGDSGNGAHALILLPDYPPHGEVGGRSPEWERLKRVHTALCKRFSTEAVKLDRSILNPSRIWRVYGTLNIKGGNTPDRPHRMARLLPFPDDLRPLDILAYEEAMLHAIGMDTPTRLNLSLNLPNNGEGEAIAPERSCDLPPWWPELITPGDRNNAAYRRAKWLLNATEGNCMEDAAWDELRAWNKDACRPPLDEQELRKTFDSANKAGDNPTYAYPRPDLGEGLGVRASGDAPWPAPLAAEAFHGLAGEIVRAIEPHTEADPAAVLVQLLVAAGSAFGRGPYFRIGADHHHTNLFTVIVGRTSAGRKGTSWSESRAVLREADDTWEGSCIRSGLSSGEGLITAVRDPTEKREPVRKDGKVVDYQLVITDEGVADKRLLVVEGEFSSVLKQAEREGNILSAVLRNGWDSGLMENMTKSGQRATDAHISLIGHITVEELRRYLTSTEAVNGFANRFIWFGAKRSKLLPEGGRPDTARLACLSERLNKALTSARNAGEMQRDTDARAIWFEIYAHLSRETPGLLGSVITRAAPIVMRLSMIYALLDESPVIGRVHLLAALALWEYAEASCRFIFGDSLGDPLADDLLRRLRAVESQGMTRTVLSAALGRHKDAHRLDHALSLLHNQGRIRTERSDTGGRPVETYFAV